MLSRLTVALRNVRPSLHPIKRLVLPSLGVGAVFRLQSIRTFSAPAAQKPQSQQQRAPQLQKRNRVNEKIISPKIRVVAEDGTNHGVMDRAAALQFAKSKELDLVELSFGNGMSVARMITYSKFKHLQEKREKELKKASQIKEKEIQLTLRIDPHDLEIKMKQTKQFLTKGYEVKVVVKTLPETPQDAVKQMLIHTRNNLQGFGQVNESEKFERNYILVHPISQKKKKSAAKPSTPAKPAAAPAAQSAAAPAAPASPVPATEAAPAPPAAQQ